MARLNLGCCYIGALVVIALLVQVGRADPFYKVWKDKIQAYMEADLAPCAGQQVTMKDLDFGSWSSPDDVCVKACADLSADSKYLGLKYSGADLLCCCSKVVAAAN